MKIKLPKLVSYQQEVYDWLGDPYESGKIAVIKSVRQCGKTFFCQAELILMATQHPGSASYIFEPTLGLARKVFKSMDKALQKTGLVKSSNATVLEIELTNGSSISFRSTEQLSRGLTVTGLLILDECAYLDDEVIFEILPLVNAHRAPIIIASTPFTQDGYYYTMYSLGLEGTNAGVRTFDWAASPDITRFITPEQIELYKQTMSPQKFRTEVLGQFLTSDGLLFIGIDKCVASSSTSDLWNESTSIFLGIDFATGSNGDSTVLTGVNALGHQVCQYRTNFLSPMEQVEWLSMHIHNLASRFEIRSILGEINSIGKVYCDALNLNLQDLGKSITEWVTTNESKRQIVEELQIAFENQGIEILDDWVLLNELRRYQMEINPKTKTVTYNGAGGSHDDTVIALCLAYHAYKQNLGNFSISFA